MAGVPRSSRPFRIYDEKARMDIPWRAYRTAERAIERCLALVYWLEVGNSYTVYEANSSTAIIQVTRRIDGLRFYQDKKGRLT
jgi:hypothetical protein